MRKTLILLVVALFVLSVPVLVLELIEHFKVKPEVVIPEKIAPTPDNQLDKPTPPEKPTENKLEKDTPSKEFLKGYWDGQEGKWIGPLRWTFHEDYRLGHMMGAHDKKSGLERYPKPDQKSKN